MGLDNGICIRRTKFTNNLKKLTRFEKSYDKEHKYDFELCYWRKCWNIRALIYGALNTIPENDSIIPLSVTDIERIIIELKLLNKDTWDERDSIWTWKEQKPHIKRHIKNLKYIRHAMKKYPELEVYFYDSY